MMRRLFPALALLAQGACTAVAPAAPDAAAAAPSPLGYPTVSDARAALTARADVRQVTTGSYDLFSDEANQVLWVFTRPGHAAYPAVVRRQLMRTGGRIVPQSAMLCQAEPAPCALLLENAHLMDRLIAAEMSRSAGPQRPARMPPPPAPDPPPPALRI